MIRDDGRFILIPVLPHIADLEKVGRVKGWMVVDLTSGELVYSEPATETPFRTQTQAKEWLDQKYP